MFKNWEYWPSKMFYIPLLPYGFYLMLKSKSVGFFSATNPAIEGSGNGMESKYKTIELLPNYCKPISIYIPEYQDVDMLLSEIKEHQLSYPLIIKPDIGFRGLLVKKINSEATLTKLPKFSFRGPTALGVISSKRAGPLVHRGKCWFIFYINARLHYLAPKMQ